MISYNSIEHLPLRQRRQIVVFGAAVVDLVAGITHLPSTGEDLALNTPRVHVGGSALNIAIALSRLGIAAVNAIPIGCGYWADIIKQRLALESISSSLQQVTGDNGWCLALVDPKGERTFLSVSGVEQSLTSSELAKLQVETNALVYICGYQLVDNTASTIVAWLKSLAPTVQILVDFGPRIAEIPKIIITELLTLNTLFTLNRQEAYYLQKDWLQLQQHELQIDTLREHWFKQYNTPLIVRVDKEGAYGCCSENIIYAPALPTHIIDTIGAGDSHCAGVLAALAADWPLAEALMFANAIASYVVSHQGGDCAPDPEQLADYLKNRNTIR